MAQIVGKLSPEALESIQRAAEIDRYRAAKAARERLRGAIPRGPYMLYKDRTAWEKASRAFAALAGLKVNVVRPAVAKQRIREAREEKPRLSERQKQKIAAELTANVGKETRRLVRASGGPARIPTARVR